MLLQLGAIVTLAATLNHGVDAAITTAGFSVHELDIEHHQQILVNSSANTARVFLCWKYLQDGPSPINMSLTVEDAVRFGSAYVDEFLKRAELQRGINVTITELNALTSLGYRLLPSIGDGGANCLPQVVSNLTGGSPVALDPNIVGSETYLAQTFILARVLTRLTAQSSVAIQLANELNYCWVAALGGEFHWKDGSLKALAKPPPVSGPVRHLPSPALWAALSEAKQDSKPHDGDVSWLVDLIGQWGNATFINRVVGLLRSAVRAENDTIPTTINYMVDVPQTVAVLAEMPHWTDLAQTPLWAGAADIVAIDTYPNFLFGSPVQGGVVAERVATAVGVAQGKPVWIAETGIGVLGDPELKPQFPAMAFTAQNQADYFTAAFNSAQDAGASGFIMFGWWSDVGIAEPEGGFIQTDQEAAMAAAAVYLNGTSELPQLVDFVASNLDYAITRMPTLFSNVSTHFGVFDATQTRRPAAEALQSLFREAELNRAGL